MNASEVLLKKAEIIGLRAPVDVVPDPTVEGFDHWKADLLTYFGCAIDSFLDKNHLSIVFFHSGVWNGRGVVSMPLDILPFLSLRLP